ncbi:MAG: hypothetical protein ACI89X_001476 [Planctomycetota bacterium]|jgi:hypothetical protein
MSIARLGRWAITVTVGLVLLSCSASFDDRLADAASAPAIDFEKPDAESGVNGRLEIHEGLRVLRLWGTSEQRGHAHGLLMAKDIFAIMNQEFAARFAGAPKLLVQARAALSRLIEYPDEFATEIDSLWRGLMESGIDRSMAKLGREFDKTDLLVANALDVFGLMGCSSFTVWGEHVVGGGVLTARNFDWPLTGDHMLDHTLLIVQMPAGATATASVAWPGYVGTVTGISADGVAAYLHVGSAIFSMPEPSSWPAAVAARLILQAKEQGAMRLKKAEEVLEYTSPPVGYMTHVVLPEAGPGDRPVAVFETDSEDTVVGGVLEGAFVVTNHFRTRKDGRVASRDSTGREAEMQKGIAGCIKVADRAVDPDEAWEILASVEAAGGHSFGTLHSLVFRHDPWHFELRVADHNEDGLIGAPSSSRRYRLTREQVFAGAASGKSK